MIGGGKYTGALFTAHANILTAYTASYFHSLLVFSAATSYFGGGADDGMAFRPAEVMVLGFEWEKRGRMKVFKRERMKS